MKKIIITIGILFISLPLLSQGLEFRLRGGVNMQSASATDNNVSFTLHAGAKAGLRISDLGFYGELLYSKHDNKSWPSAASYLVPAVIFRYYGFRFVYVEAGMPYYLLFGEQPDPSVMEIPDKNIGVYAGVGLVLGKLEIGLRANAPAVSLQATASYRLDRRRSRY